MGISDSKFPRAILPRLREIQPNWAEHPLSKGSVFGMTGEALANLVRGEAAGEALRRLS